MNVTSVLSLYDLMSKKTNRFGNPNLCLLRKRHNIYSLLGIFKIQIPFLVFLKSVTFFSKKKGNDYKTLVNNDENFKIIGL